MYLALATIDEDESTKLFLNGRIFQVSILLFP